MSSIILLLILCLLVEVRGDHKIEVLIESYHNPTHTQSDGRCCHYDTNYERRCTDCYNKFTFCIRQDFGGGSASTEVDELCPKQATTYATDIVGKDTGYADNISFKGLNFNDEGNNITNPLVFIGKGVWPGSAQFVVIIKNLIYYTTEELVDYNITNWTLSLNAPFERRELNGMNGKASLIISARMECVGSMLCGNCTQICESSSGSTQRGQADSQSDELVTQGSMVSISPGRSATKDSNALGIVHQKSQARILTIGITVGVVIFSLMIATVTIICLCCARKKIEGGKRSEKQPFLHNNLPQGESVPYLNQAMTDEEDSDEDEANNPRYVRQSTNKRTGREQSDTELKTPTNNSCTLQDFNRVEKTCIEDSEDTSDYTMIRMQDMIASTTSSALALSDIAEASDREEGDEAVVGHDDSAYSMIIHEQMDDISDAESFSEKEEEEEEGDGVTSSTSTTRPRLPSPSNYS